MLYADYNATAPLCGPVCEFLKNKLNCNGPYANPNSVHVLGKKIQYQMESSRKKCADILGADPTQIFFTSGSSEGISQVFHSLLCKKQNKNIIITSELEHAAVHNACLYYKEEGYEIIYIKTLPNGTIDIKDFEAILNKYKDNIAIVSIMAANNETGVLQPYEKIALLCKNYSIPYFSDTTQLIGKAPFHFKNSNLDFAVLSGHKIGALIGTGILMVRDPQILKPLIFGGGQERGSRGGTQNYLGNETLALALEYFDENKHNLNLVTKYRENFESKILEKFPKAIVIAQDGNRLASSTLIAYPPFLGHEVQQYLESREVYVTTASACSDKKKEISRTLKAMGINEEIGHSVVRISLSFNAKEDEYLRLTEELSNAYHFLNER